MAISGFGRAKNRTTAPASPGVASGGFGNLTAFLDQGSEFEGKLSFKDTVRIDGTFSGEISSLDTLVVGESGQITATIRSVRVVISGFVEGNVVASDQVVLHKTAVVNGDIRSPVVVMEEGAQLNGRVEMGTTANASAASQAAPTPPAENAGDAEGEQG